MNIIDSHLHIGNISDTDIVTPKQVKSFLTSMGVSNGLVMPAALRGGNDDWEIHKKLYEEAIDDGFNVALYVNTKMLTQSKDLDRYFISPFKALKIHPDAVAFSNQQIEQVCTIAEKRMVPLMIHTGANESCRCNRFRPFILNHPELTFVLCHARPADEAFLIMRECLNVWIDTAFLNFSDLLDNISKDVEDRIMFGTDFPVNRWFPHLGEDYHWYANQISQIQETLSKDIAEKLFYKNYFELFQF